MATGKVKWFDSIKDFGFLITDSDEDVFVVGANVQTDDMKSLEADDRVSFDIIEGSRGPQAVHVRKIGISAAKE